LCGWSFGGVVAFEMAVQLIRAGEEIAFLALLDSRLHLPGAPLILRADEDPVGLFLRDHGLDRGGSPGPSRTGRALAEARRRGIIPQGLSLEEFSDLAVRYGTAFRDHVALARAYSPTGRVPRLLVVEATDRPPGRATPALTWTECADHLMREQVPGDHFSILRPPHVDAVARILARHLQLGEWEAPDSVVGSRSGRGVGDDRDVPRRASALPYSRRNSRDIR